MFTETIMETAMKHDSFATGSAATYLYEFAVNTSAHPSPCPSWCCKGTHGDELSYIFFEESGGLFYVVYSGISDL